MNETAFLAGLVAAIVTILTKFIDALVARRRDRSTGSLEHRKLLSDDERAFRQAVLDEVKELRDELEKKSTLLDEIRQKLSTAHEQARESDRRCAEAERRSLMLEAQVADLRALHASIQESKRAARRPPDEPKR